MKEEIEKETIEKMLYHISPNAYTQGEVVGVDDFSGTTLYYRGLDSEKKGINDYLSENRPAGSPSRSQCIYTFDKIEYCVYFRSKELLAGKTFHLYRCKMDNPNGHPMVLVGKMESVSGQDREKLRNEYWNPTNSWNLLEYMSDRIVILEEIPITAALKTRSLMIGACDYSQDFDKVKYYLNHQVFDNE